MSHAYGKILNILLVEDSKVAQLEVKKQFETDGTTIRLTAVDTLRKGTEFAQDEDSDFDLVILDLHLPDSPDSKEGDGDTGLATFRRWMQCCPHIPVVVFTARGDDFTAMKCIAEGAQDYLFKGDVKFLPRVCQYAVERWHKHRELRAQKDLLQSILDHTSELIIRFKPDFTISFLNRRMQDVIDYHTRDFDKSCAVDFVRGVPGVMEIVKTLSPSKPHSDIYEMRICGRYVAWTFAAIYDVFGHLVEYQALGRDVTYKLMSAKEMADTINEKLNEMKRSLGVETRKVEASIELAALAVRRLQEEVPIGE